MDKDLRLYAAEVVVSSKMSKPAKIQMLEFIQKEATDVQVKALLLDGKIVKLDEQAEGIINDRFNLLEIDPLVGGAILGGLLGPPAVKAATKFYINWISKAGQACSSLQGKEKQFCIKKYRLNGKIKALQSLLNKCNNSKNPEKCKQKVQEQIKATQSTLDSLRMQG